MGQERHCSTRTGHGKIALFIIEGSWDRIPADAFQTHQELVIGTSAEQDVIKVDEDSGNSGQQSLHLKLKYSNR